MAADGDVERQFRRFRRISRWIGWWPRRLAVWFGKLRTRWVIATGDFDQVRGILRANLEPVLPPGEDPGPVVESLLRKYGLFLTDYFRIPSMRADRFRPLFRPLKGQEHVQAALQKGKGAILVTPHLGNWELGGIAMRLMGMPVTVVAVPDNVNPGVTRYRDWARSVHGIRVLNIGPGLMTPLELARALEENHLVAMLADRNFFEADPVEVEFFGRKAWFPRGPALLALATGAPILPAFVTLGEGDKYDAEVCAPVPVPEEGTKPERAAAAIRSLARLFEERIRSHPDQWFIFDPFWSGAEPLSNTAREAAGLAGGGSVSPLQ